MVLKQGLTAEEYLAIPEEPPYLEYVNGEVVPKAMPNFEHGALERRIAARFDAYGESSGGYSGAEIRCAFDEGPRIGYRLPDFVYWAPGKPRGDRHMALPPTLAIEIRSPDESMANQRAKCRYFREHGVEVAWLIDPGSRTVEVFEGADDGRALAGDADLTSPHLPGFRLPLSDLFSVL